MMEYSFPQYELDRLQERKWILKFVNKEKSIGAEIGVFRGHFSRVLIETLNPEKIYLVDLWRMIGPKYDWGPRSKSEYLSNGEMTPAIALSEVRAIIDEYPNEIHVVESDGVAFMHRLTEKLDWVYLDTSHKYLDTIHELKAIDTVLDSGGLIMGDDWFPDSGHRHHGVYQAVNEFLSDGRYELLDAGTAQQWAIRKK